MKPSPHSTSHTALLFRRALTVLAIAFGLVAGGLQAQTFSTTTLDGPYAGEHTSQAIVNGNPAISYYDLTGALKYVRANDPSGTSWGTPVTVDSGDQVGLYTSLAVVDGYPAISYQGVGLKYVRANDASGASWGTPVTVDSSYQVGRNTSLAVVNGHPAISYQGGNLKYVRASDASGATWGTPVTFTGSAIADSQTTLAVVNGNPAICYSRYGIPGRVEYVRANDANGASWGTPVTAATFTFTADQYTSMAIVDGNPAISYCDNVFNINYVRANDPSGASWGTPVTVATAFNESQDQLIQYNSLAVVNGKPAISYYEWAPSGGMDESDDLKYVRANNSTGASWGTVLTIDSIGDVGAYNSLAFVDGNPAVSYYDGSNGNLKWAVAVTPAPEIAVTSVSPAVGGPGASVTITGYGFTDASSVTIGGVAVTSFTVVDDNTITTTIPAGIAGTVNVVVTSPGGTGTGTGLFSVVDYVITVTGTSITATNVTGTGDTLEMSLAGSDLVIAASGRSLTVNGGAVTSDAADPIPLTGITSVTVDVGAGYDIINIYDLSAVDFPSLTVNGGTGDDEVSFLGDIVFADDASLDVDLQDDAVTPGEDRIVVDSAYLGLSGGSVVLRASRSVNLEFTTIQTYYAPITIEANQQAVPSSDPSAGVVLSGAVVISEEAPIVINGKGGDVASGIDLQISQLSAYNSTLTLVGVAGAHGMAGVSVEQTSIQDADAVFITGTHPGADGGITAGVQLIWDSFIQGVGFVTISGTNLITDGNENHGVFIDQFSYMEGIERDLTIVGTAGAGTTADPCGGHGVYCQGYLSVQDSVTITGTAGRGTGMLHGILLDGFNPTGQGIRDVNYDITLTGSSGEAAGIALMVSDMGLIQGYGGVTLITDGLDIQDPYMQGGKAVPDDGFGSPITIKPLTAGVPVDIGGTDVFGPGARLGISSEELALLDTEYLTLGSSTAGSVQVVDNVTRDAMTNVTLSSGGVVDLSGGTLNTAGGDLTVDPGTSLRGSFTGTDLDLSANPGTLSLASGKSLGVTVTSASSYDTLTLLGQVNLTGSLLSVQDGSAGAYTPSAVQTFTIIDNDGTDPVTGTFTGLAEGAAVSVNGVNKVITYIGGDGNDVVLKGGSNTAPTITSNGGGASASIDVAENTTAVTTVIATDTDLPAQTITYSKSGPDAGLFTFSAGGVLTFIAAPDFEGPHGNTYAVTVTATDDGSPTLSDSQALTILVTDVADAITTASGEHVITAAGAPDATGADSGAKFDLLKRGGFLADNGHLVFPGELTVGIGGVTASPNNFMGLWKEGGTGLKLLARSGDAAPGTDAVFDILPTVPAINDSGEVTFLASLSLTGGTTPATTTNDIGLWSELGSTGLQLLVREDDLLPTQVPPLPAGTKVGAFASGAYATAHTSATTGEAAFAITFKGSSTDSAVLRASVNPSTVALSVIARQNTIAPGTTQNFGSLNGSYTDSMRMDATGNLVFVALLTSPSNEGIWYQPLGGAVTKAFIAGDTAPGTSGATFKNIKSPAIGSAGVITFRGQLNTNGDNASNAKNDGIWRGTVAGGFSSILRRGDSGYAGMPGGSKVGNVWHGWLNNANHGAWRAWLNVNGNGVASSTANGDVNAIFTDINGGVMEMAVKIGDAAPGIPGATFASMDLPVVGSASATPSANEWVAFIGKVTGGGTTAGVDDLGIWRKTGAGAFTLLLRAGTTITTTEGTKTIQKVDLPGSGATDRRWEQPVMDNTGRMLIYVQFIDGSSTQLLTP